jgi:hypothetical protein
MNKRYFEGHIYHFLHQVPPDLLLDVSGGYCHRAEVNESEFSPVSIIPPWFSVLIYHLLE